MSKINIGKDLYLKGRIGWKGLKKDEYLKKSEYRIINATALEDRIIDWRKSGYISKERYEESPEIMLKEKDILISKDGTLGKIGFVNNLEEKTTVASGIFVLRNTKNEILDTEYMYHYLKSNIFKRFINKNKALGSTILHLYQKDLEKLEIELPAIERQRKISRILSNLDNKIELNNKLNQKLEEMAKTLYDYWFVQFDFPNENGEPYKSSGGRMVFDERIGREVPVGWEVRKIEDYCNIFTGKKNVTESLECGKYKFFSCAPEYRYSNEKLYSGKAILISGNGSYTGRTIFIEDKFDLYQRTYACVNKDEKDDILYYIFFSMLKYFVPKVSGGTHGSAIPYIVYNDIAKEKILIKNNIINKFLSIVVPYQKKIRKIKEENEKLIGLRDWLLPMLMNGQIKIEDKGKKESE
ncbi:type I restriction modification DNA specificity domain protein [Pseudoleptotrichia goodfellowii]|uniref:Type I restriction modification DNA specificity domain protein n=1 Tax=Pseudoleptotrichia goodfellowii TaxID=157692 RepID=A0A510JAR8_9FUSO|nr:restriction endonuclease subunit S [Pseudoleptotrichia goodfellowii]BBM36176.1 type I restriction modification DNA specificity domain protein [Pseudoleptotrichia goodfellowii]